MDKTILKAQRKKSSSKGKSSLPQKTSASIKGGSVADCYDQTTLKEFASSKDLVMVKAVEEPSAITRTGLVMMKCSGQKPGPIGGTMFQ